MAWKFSIFYFFTVNHQQTSRQEICKPATSAVEERNMFLFLFQFLKHYISDYINYINDKFLVSKKMIYT